MEHVHNGHQPVLHNGNQPINAVDGPVPGLLHNAANGGQPVNAVNGPVLHNGNPPFNAANGLVPGLLHNAVNGPVLHNDNPPFNAANGLVPGQLHNAVNGPVLHNDNPPLNAANGPVPGLLQAAPGLLLAQAWSQRITVILFVLPLVMFILNFIRTEDLITRAVNFLLGTIILLLACVKVIKYGGLAQNLRDSEHHIAYILLPASAVQFLLVSLDFIFCLVKVKYALHYCPLGFFLSTVNMVMLLYPVLRPLAGRGDSRE